MMSIANKTAYVQACNALAGLPADALGLFAELCKPEIYSAGDLIADAGDPADRIFVVCSGQIAVRLRAEAPVIRMLDRGALSGEYGMYVSGVRPNRFEAVTDCILLSLDYRTFRNLLMSEPVVMDRLFAAAVKRLNDAEAKIAELEAKVGESN